MEARKIPKFELRSWVAVITLALILTGCAPAQVAQPEPTQSELPAVTVKPTEAPDLTAIPTRTPLPDVPIVRADPESTGASSGESGSVPTMLMIAERDVRMPVLPVGVTPDGSMEIPYSSDEAGWYRFGVGVGANKGTAVVAGHVDSFATLALGPLAKLPEAKAGDLVQVSREGGGDVDYRVTSVEKTSKTQIDWPGVFTRDGAHKLVMITCGGEWDRAARNYEDNIIVSAEPVTSGRGS